MRGLLILAVLAAAAAVGSCAYSLDSKKQITEQKVFSGVDFPAARPPMWNPIRTLEALEAVSGWTCKPKGNGFDITINHEPFPGITPDMMVWMYQNLANDAVTVDIDGKSYPLFVALHPIDHMFAKLTPASPTGPTKKGSIFQFVEFPLTKCTYDENGLHWTYPTGANPGWLKTSNPADWEWLDSTNVTTSKVLSFGKKSIKFGNRNCKQPAGSPCGYTVKTTHKWKEDKKATSPQLLITTNVRVGIGLSEIDKNITKGWMNGITPASVKCARVATHFVAEYGGLLGWLKSTYEKYAVGR